jgi:hypothetical protein
VRASECAEINGFDGVGFVFSEDDHFCGVDIDDCIIDGELTEEAQALVDRLGSYTEISPSGTGVKIFGICTKQFKGRNENGLEYYTNKRFFTFTQNCINCEDLADLTWWFEEKHAGRKEAAGDVRRSEAGGEVVSRARIYLHGCKPCIQGQGGDGQLFQVASQLVNGFELSKDDAVDLLWNDFNPRCNPPWDYHDIEYKVDCALKTASQQYIGNKRDSVPVTVSVSEADEMAAGLLSNRKQEGIPKRLLWLPPDSPLSVMRDYIVETSARDCEALAFTGALAWYCGLISGKVMDESGSTTNLYTITLAPSSGGKQAPQDAIRAVVDDSSYSQWLGGKVTSDSAIGAVLKESPSALCLWDEVGLFLQKARGGVQASITDQLLDLWGATNSRFRLKQYADSEKDIVIDRPAFGFAGWSTADHFWNGLTRMHLRDGFAGRLLVFNTGERGPRKRKRYVRAPQSLVDITSRWGATNHTIFQEAGLARRPEAQMMMVDDEAEEMFSSLWDKVEEFTADDDQAVWGRAPEKARKIAIAFAACKGPEARVTQEHAERACELIDFATESFMAEARLRLTADDDHKTIRVELLTELKRRDGVCYSGPLLKALGCSSTVFEKVLRTLEDSSRIKVAHEGGGRRKVVYCG